MHSYRPVSSESGDFIVQMVFWIIILLVVFWGALRTVFPAHRISSRDTTKESSLETLKKRYDSGDISTEEFERLKKDLLE